ncbi:murein L,D-transpeptidase catalytic domain family protein [Parasediminibacterium sp. JCM 36343]|uniref:murein L,D-transpeptidase catalytic domain family protein n=1 Tax=Parasediminibacterium sp. JCM 36343 TaxID=3374279 RepID=UPI00397ACBA8
MRYFFSKKRHLALPFLLFFATPSFSKAKVSKAAIGSIAEKKSLYNQLNLAALGLKQEIFEKALAGWDVLYCHQSLQKAGLLSIADMSQSSNSKRLYIIDMEKKIVLFNTYVAHGRNSGEEFAKSFANKANSFKSSLGFYITGDTYQGAHGLSLRLKGIEKGINDGAEQRGIVIHGAPYVSESFIKQCGRLGRSQGCPAVPQELCTPIVNHIKQGSCFYMYYPDKNYFKHTSMG